MLHDWFPGHRSTVNALAVVGEEGNVVSGGADYSIMDLN
jgi:hypothetical protein